MSPEPLPDHSTAEVERDSYPRDLRGAHDYWKATAKAWGGELDRLRAENERLRKALTDIARMSTPSRMQSRANRALAPASDENGETT